jgi:hypothetical protein
MTRLRGWAPRGGHLVDKVPQGKWKTATFLAALRSDRIDAPCLFDGANASDRVIRIERSIWSSRKASDSKASSGSDRSSSSRRWYGSLGQMSGLCNL